MRGHNISVRHARVILNHSNKKAAIKAALEKEVTFFSEMISAEFTILRVRFEADLKFLCIDNHLPQGAIKIAASLCSELTQKKYRFCRRNYFTAENRLILVATSDGCVCIPEVVFTAPSTEPTDRPRQNKHTQNVEPLRELLLQSHSLLQGDYHSA